MLSSWHGHTDFCCRGHSYGHGPWAIIPPFNMVHYHLARYQQDQIETCDANKTDVVQAHKEAKHVDLRKAELHEATEVGFECTAEQRANRRSG